MSGLRTTWREEVNFRIEVGVSIAVIALSVWLRVSLVEQVILIGCVVAVLSAELVNTAIEDLCNKVEPSVDPAIGKVKDIMAAYVLVVSLGAVIVGAIIFSDYFYF